ncbi:MAG: hypothetical protein JNG89_13255, partial [Planctomycetaceae bacterium]|nr:hypothetical protein [Planctomycetaceae bacterium]
LWIESRVTLIDDAAGTSVDYYQCASCKSEDTFAEQNLFYTDNYDFCPIYGDGQWLIFRRKNRVTPDYRRIQKLEEVWGIPDLKLAYAKNVRPLSTWEEIRDVTATTTPMVAQTELSDPQTGLRAIIECPVKTMNISHEKRMYQIDTGPVAFADVSRRFANPIESLSLAFIAFNTPDFADFVIEQPTPVIEDGVERCRTLHYSTPISRAARNILLAHD